MHYGMVHGGIVRHVVKTTNVFDMLISTCGRVILPGDSDSRLCKTCARINKISALVFPTNEVARELINGCGVDHRHITPENFCERRPNGVKFSGTELSMFRDVLSDWAAGAENDACWIGTLAILTDSPKLIREVITPELGKRQGGKGNGGLIDPKNAKPARTPFAGTQPQRELIESLVRQIDEINAEIYPTVSSLAADYTEEQFASLNTRAKVKKDIDDLFKILGILKSKRTQKRAEARKSETDTVVKVREWRRNQVYVIDGVFHRVHISQSTGRPYTQSWNEGEWVYQGMKFLKRCTDATACSTEQAKAWAHEHNSCVFCHKPLDDQRSRDAGYGSTCADNNGLPWGE